MIVAGTRSRLWSGRGARPAVRSCSPLVWLLPLLAHGADRDQAERGDLRGRNSVAHAASDARAFRQGVAAAPFGRYYLNSSSSRRPRPLLVAADRFDGGLCAVPAALSRRRSVLLGGMLATTMVPFQVLLIPFFILLTDAASGELARRAGRRLCRDPAALRGLHARAASCGTCRARWRRARALTGASWFGIWWRIACRCRARRSRPWASTASSRAGRSSSSRS